MKKKTKKRIKFFCQFNSAAVTQGFDNINKLFTLWARENIEDVNEKLSFAAGSCSSVM